MPVDTEARLAFLRQPDSYGATVTRVEVIETHMSWVFLAGDEACKLKKPVHNDYVDFRSADMRCHFCTEELRLNRRLAPDIYLRVDTLSADANGQLHFGADGERIDCVVRMRRLPERALLSYALLHQSADVALVRRIAARIADFHHRLPSQYPDPEAWRASIGAEIERNETALRAHPAAIPAIEVGMLCNAQRDLLSARSAWFDARIRDGHIVEGHGDLRAEHVFFSDGDSVGAIDCLEFSRALRTLDAADDIAFLALDCERLHAPALAAELLHAYCTCANDWPTPDLLHFYQSLRAAIRARIAAQHLDEEAYRHSPQWAQRARDWLALARRHQDCIRSTIDPP